MLGARAGTWRQAGAPSLRCLGSLPWQPRAFHPYPTNPRAAQSLQGVSSCTIPPMWVCAMAMKSCLKMGFVSLLHYYLIDRSSGTLAYISSNHLASVSGAYFPKRHLLSQKLP